MSKTSRRFATALAIAPLLAAALACRPDHISAYALIIEDGTRLAAQIRRGEVPPPVDDDQADFYEVADRERGHPGTGQEAVLEAVRQSSLGMSNAVKYSENPGREAREEVVELLSGNGYTGTAEIWYAELPESESGANDRYAGVYVRLSNDTETTFLKLAGRDKLTARSTAVWTIHPYSTGNVYRPADVGNGSLEATFEDGTVTVRDRDAMTQVRLKVDELPAFIGARLVF